MPGVYLSFPFCAQKCTFCNFASGVFPRELELAYIEALLGEISLHSWRWKPETLYIGGGTPSRIGLADLTRILHAVPGGPWREATIEAAPGSLATDLVRGWIDAGLNRVSLGVQSFVKKELAGTGRRHDAGTVASDVALLREHGITNFNIDLIAGLPWQTPESWDESLDAVERLAPPHVSVYMFEVDEDSRLGLQVLHGGEQYGASAVPSEDVTAELYETAVRRLAAAGIERYEISNFAVPGMESLHNLKYWTGEPYVGFGADAHSFDGVERWGNAESAREYVGAPFLRRDRSRAIPEEEKFFLGLRLMRGVEMDTADAERFGSRIDRLIDAGVLTRDGSRVSLTPRGVLVSNEVFGEFIQ